MKTCPDCGQRAYEIRERFGYSEIECHACGFYVLETFDSDPVDGVSY
jgi:transcription initiation factor TFIIIB Brf1 subunit/transcription initiation factor TFIIB